MRSQSLAFIRRTIGLDLGSHLDQFALMVSTNSRLAGKGVMNGSIKIDLVPIWWRGKTTFLERGLTCWTMHHSVDDKY